METAKEILSRHFDIGDFEKKITVLKDALLKKLNGDITQDDLDNVCVDTSLNYLSDYSAKPLPTKPEELSQYDTMFERERKQMSADERSAIKKKRWIYNDECCKIQNINSSNHQWLVFMSDNLERRQMFNEKEEVDEVIAGFIEFGGGER